ncbi:CheR family methyltransferase [Paraburkholderia sp. J12]|uniref:CheR family methyltransferase n=1 Tax=Paraburkholderia sp. J12 TaxID=2805432 RepID=UPI002ABE9604|nr:CheR family methyltransferase [Paraburkholderia sp. J12]
MNDGDPRFAAWLLHETGIDAQALGANALMRAVAQRAAVTIAGEQQAGIPPAWEAGSAVPCLVIDAYWLHLTSEAAERQALIDALVVPETWFFREREAFAALARLGMERLARRPGDVLRVLSVPCSSGEEPYSAAMALLDAGLTAEQFGIDAIDISSVSIAAAQRGVYGRNAFRGDGLAFRERHFEAVEDGWCVSPQVRAPVTFERANLFEWLAAHPVRYDFIFCRNVLIYFDRDAQDRAMGLLRACLADDGMIFVGPAETGLMMRHEMVSAYIPLAFGFRLPNEGELGRRAFAPHFSPAPAPVALRALHTAPALTMTTAASMVPHQPLQPSLNTPWMKPAVPAAPSRALRAPRAMASASAPARSATSVAATPPHETLAQARSLADAGDLDGAHRLALQAAHDATEAAAPDADAWYLLGLIADAQGHPAEARDHYRKALYLEPAHYEALTHLAVLLEVQGDRDGAHRLMRRAERAAPPTPRQGGADV